MVAPGYRPIANARTASPRYPAEWFVAVVFGSIGCWVHFHTTIQWESPERTLYRQLAFAFGAGFTIMFALAYGQTLLREVTSNALRWAGLTYAIALAFGIRCFIAIHASRYLLNRILESAALGAALSVLALTLFLPVAGLVRPRKVAIALGESLGLWAPYLVYFAFCGVCLSATLRSTPLVWDSVLLRMDLSLGFNPSQIAFAWHFEFPWINRLAEAAYGLLGLLIAGVIARLHFARAWNQARRALLASFLVGVLGLGCYQLIPAVGPIYGYPALYRDLDSPLRRAEALAALKSALTDPDRVAGTAGIIRNGMPSLHVAFTLVALAAAWCWRRRFFWWCLPLGTLLIATTLPLGYHYVVDILAAVPLSALSWWTADVLVRATPSSAGPPLPPLPAGSPGRGRRSIWLGLSLVASVAALIIWGKLAPLSPWIAWPLALFVVAGPSWASFGADSRRRIPTSIAL